jgi:hypothetical protein
MYPVMQQRRSGIGRLAGWLTGAAESIVSFAEQSTGEGR